MNGSSGVEIILLLVDASGLEPASQEINILNLWSIASPKTLVVVVALGPGGGVCLAATPMQHIHQIDLPHQLHVGHPAGADVALDALYEAIHLSELEVIHLSELEVPTVCVVTFIDWGRYAELGEQLRGIESLHFVASFGRRALTVPERRPVGIPSQKLDATATSSESAVLWGAIVLLIVVVCLLVAFFLM
jgi:hypothetical protein